MPPHASESPAKKQSKWSPEEDALIIDLRGSGMKWEDISKRLPGRSAISCRLHYQNYLERRSEWDEERKNKLARLYERFKPEMWAKVAEEMAIPWRAAEAMHWQLGEHDMARRAGVTPFSLTAVNVDNQAGSARNPPRGHHHSQSHGSLPRDLIGPARVYGRGGTVQAPGRPLASRRDSVPPPPPPMSVPTDHIDSYVYGPPHAHPPPPPHVPHHGPPPPQHGGPLAPIQAQPQSRAPGMLPGVAELTTGVSPYSTPAYAAGVPSVSPAHSATASPNPFVAMPAPPSQHASYAPPPLHDHSTGPSSSIKRPRSPESTIQPPDLSRRRQYHHQYPEPLDNSSVPRHLP